MNTHFHFRRVWLAPVTACLGLCLNLASAAGQVGATTPQDTIITSNYAELRNDAVEAYTMFRDNVRLTGTNLEVTCDLLEVFAEEITEPGETTGRLGPMRTRRLVATGNVVIKQAGREAVADQVEVLPLEDVVILTGDPVRVTDTQGTYEGTEIRFRRGDRQIEITKPRGVFRPLPNLGFPQESQESRTSAPENAGEAAPPPPPSTTDATKR